MSASSQQFQSEKIIFNCDRHAENISEKLWDFYEKEEFFDTILIAGSNSVDIKAHRIVLSAMSPYFSDIFRNSFKAQVENVIKLKEVDATALRWIVNFMYSGWIELSIETAENILRAAVFLKMKTLYKVCYNFIEKRITPSSCLNWLRMARELSLTALQAKCLKYTCTHFEELSKEKELLLLNETELKEVLFNDNPHRNYEKHIFLCLVAWIKHDKTNREHLLFQFLSLIRYQFLTDKFIIENRRSVCKTVETYELICSWIQWHISPRTRSADQKKRVLLPRKIDGKLAVISKTDTENIQIQSYSPEDKVWLIEGGTKLSAKKCDYTPIVIDDKKLILIGGYIHNRATNSVNCLDLKTSECTDLPPMRKARYWSQLANLNGKLCVFGGLCNGFVDSVEMYNFTTRTWSDVQLLSKPSQYSKIVAHNGILYIVDFQNGCLQSFDVSSNQCSLKEIPNENLKNFGLAAVNGFLYVIGGNSQDVYVKTVKRYDLSNDTWSEVAPLPKARSYIKSTVYEKKILIYGGIPDETLVKEYNPDTDTWTRLTSLSVDRYTEVVVFTYLSS